MTEKILLTGVGGFVGSHVLNEIMRTTEYDVVAVDSFNHNGAVDRALIGLYEKDFSRIDIMTHDLRAPFSWLEVMRMASVKCVINVASRPQVKESIDQPVEFITNNITLMLNVLEAARKLGKPHFIQMSTDEVYGAFHPASSCDHRPSSPYSASKAAQEDICHAYSRTYGIPMTIINSANIFGERQSQLAFIPRIIRAVINEETLKVHTPGARNYSYVGDVASRIVRAIDETMSRIPLPGEGKIENIDLAKKIAGIINKPLKYELVYSSAVIPGHDLHYWNDPIYWGRKDGLHSNLMKTVAWYLENKEWLAN